MLKWIIALLGFSSIANFPAHAELSLQTAIKIAISTSPQVSLLNANVEAAKSSAVAAGRLPDPRLAVGIDNLPATGEDRWQFNRDFMTMKRIGLMQEFPNHAKRQAQREMADAAVDQAEAERRAQLVSIRRAVATAWFDRYYLEQQVVLLNDIEKDSILLAATVKAQVSAGNGNAADVVAPQQALLELENRRDELTAAIIKARAALRRWIGDAADEPLPPDIPLLNIDTADLRLHVQSHPELSVYGPMLQSAYAALREAEAGKRPDWGVELFYAKRATDYSDMVSLQFTIGLPVAKRSRQLPKIEASRQWIQQVTAQRDQMVREHVESTEDDLAEYDSLTNQCKRMNDVLIPLAQQKVKLEYAAYQGGKSKLTEVLQSRQELLNEQLKRIELEWARALVIAKLYFTASEDQP